VKRERGLHAIVGPVQAEAADVVVVQVAAGRVDEGENAIAHLLRLAPLRLIHKLRAALELRVDYCALALVNERHGGRYFAVPEAKQSRDERMVSNTARNDLKK
jgi:hypothetical protein